MKRALLAGLLAAFTLVAAQNALALSVSVDVPYSFTFENRYALKNNNARQKESASTDTSGMILSASAGWFGVGYENYEVKGTVRLNGGLDMDFAQAYQIYDVFVDLPFPVVNVVLGVGKGRMNTTFSLPSAFNDPTADETEVSQQFIRLGWPIGPVFDVHVGYHRVIAENASTAGGGAGNPDWIGGTGTLLTFGVRAGW